MDKTNIYDLVIIGAGPAGLTSSIYASCFHLKHLVIGSMIGGQLQLAPHILNYPGYQSISGKELTEKMVGQAEAMGGRLVTQSVTRISNFQFSITNENNEKINGFEVETKEGMKYYSRAILLATGTERRKLGIKGEIKYTAKGVHYCATCEQFDYEGKVCCVIGGANSAVQAAVELAQAAKKVFIIYRGKELRGDPIWLEQIKKSNKIEVIYNTQVLEIKGDENEVTGVLIKSEIEKILSMEKVFVEIGGVPGTALVIPIGVKMDKGGYIIVDETLSTNVAGVFAAGDLVSYGLSIEQISSAVGLGARATATAFAYLKNNKAPILWGQNQINL